MRVEIQKNIIDNTFLSENDKKLYLCIYITKKEPNKLHKWQRSTITKQ